MYEKKDGREVTMEEAKIQENKMGVMPVNRLLLNMAVPMMISMLVQALYNIVDSIFVSQICEEAMTAVSSAFPIQALLIAFGTGTGVGVNAILSRSLGCKDKEQAERAAHNGIFLALVSYVVFLLVGIFLVKPFFAVQTEDPLILQYGVDYLSIVCIFSFGIYAQLIFERVLQACGYTLYTMFTQGVGAIINIIFDPIFIFGWFGLPAMGTAGAALATVMGQIIAAILALVMNKKLNREVEIHFRRVRPNWRIIAEIYRVGIASILMQAVGSVMYFGMNMILMPFTATASTVWGAFYKLESFIHSLCGDYHADWPCSIPAVPRTAAGNVLRLGLYAGDRRAGAADYEPGLSVCRCGHRLHYSLSGTGQRRLWPYGIIAATALCIAAGGLPVCQDRRPDLDLVVPPPGRVRGADHLSAVHAADLPEGHPPCTGQSLIKNGMAEAIPFFVIQRARRRF